MSERCILVLAQTGDPVLEALRRQTPSTVRHVGPRDLSRPGWRYVGGRPDLVQAVAGGTAVKADDVAGFVSRLHRITEADLPHIVPADRAYVAAEMNAFLLAWLAQFRGPCINPPSPQSLCGPGWHEAQWMRAAARLGIRVVGTRQAIGAAATQDRPRPVPEEMNAVVVGNRVLGTRDREAIRAARRLAAAAETPLLGIRFVRAAGACIFAGADSCPVLDAEVSAALLEMLVERHRAEERRWAS